MDKDFVDRHKLSLVTKKHHIPIEVIDGRLLVSGDVTHETTLLDIVIEGHHSTDVTRTFSDGRTDDWTMAAGASVTWTHCSVLFEAYIIRYKIEAI
jgi:hypothetical protein